MARKYTYKALDQKKNRIVKGTIQAEHERALEQILMDSNLTLISAKEIKKSIFDLTFLEKITTKDLITFFIHLEQLERAGVPLLDSLADLKEFSEKQQMKDISANMYESVKSGKLLSEAMEKHTKIFDNVMINLVRMGEKTGGLQEAFRNIYENLKWNADIRRKTIKAIRYPIFSLVIMIIVAGIMLKVVVPKVTKFIMDQGIKVPTYTITLIKTSEFFQKYFFKMILFGIILFILIKILSRIKSVRYYVDLIKLKIPLIGNIIIKIEMSKFTKFFGVTFASGIPILDCLTISSDIVTNTVLKDEIIRVRQDVSDGSSVSSAISTSLFFPSMVIRMLKIGEDSGNMTDAMANIQYFYSTEIDDSIDQIIGSLQPIIMFVMGGLMAWIVLAVFGPIYTNFDNLGV